MAAPGKESSAVQERESVKDEANDEGKRVEQAEQAEQAEAMQGVQTQEAAQELPVSVQKQDVQGKQQSQDTGKIAEASVEEGQHDKEKEKENVVVPEKADNGDAEHNEGQGEGDAETKPQPKKRGRPKKEQTPKKSAEEAAPSTPATPTEKPEASEETPRSKRGKKKRTELELSPALDRPSRERRSIDRFAAAIESPSSRLYIRKGSGTPLKDIPNVAYRVSQISKNDPALRLLHFILFAHSPKDSTIKSNILQFSGHAWGNKERDEQIVRQKLQLCEKKQLTELMKIFDLDIKGEQEDLCTQFMEFLQAPHATTDVVLEKEKSGNKQKGGRPKKQNSDEPPKRRRRKRKQVDDESDESLEEEEEIEQKNTYKDTDEEEASGSADTGKATEADSQDRQPRKRQKMDSKSFARKSNKNKAIKNSAKVKKDKSQTKEKSHTDKERSIQHDGGDEAQSAINHPKEDDIRPHVRELLNTLDLKEASFNVLFKHLGTRLHVDFSEPSLRTRAKAIIKEELLKPEVDKGSTAEAQPAKNDESRKEGEDTPMAEAQDQSEAAGSERKDAPSEVVMKDGAEAKDQATGTKTNDAAKDQATETKTNDTAKDQATATKTNDTDGKKSTAAQDLNEKSQEEAPKPAEAQSEQAKQDEIMAEAKSQQDEEPKSQQDEAK